MGMIFSSARTDFTDSLKGKLIVITGGVSGTRDGQELRERWSQSGCHRAAHGQAGGSRQGEREYYSLRQCVVSKDADMMKLRDEIEKMGGVDFLINS